jgi:hypothetical protein
MQSSRLRIWNTTRQQGVSRWVVRRFTGGRIIRRGSLRLLCRLTNDDETVLRLLQRLIGRTTYTNVLRLSCIPPARQKDNEKQTRRPVCKPTVRVTNNDYKILQPLQRITEGPGGHHRCMPRLRYKPTECPAMTIYECSS